MRRFALLAVLALIALPGCGITDQLDQALATQLLAGAATSGLKDAHFSVTGGFGPPSAGHIVPPASVDWQSGGAHYIVAGYRGWTDMGPQVGWPAPLWRWNRVMPPFPLFQDWQHFSAPRVVSTTRGSWRIGAIWQTMPVQVVLRIPDRYPLSLTISWPGGCVWCPVPPAATGKPVPRIIEVVAFNNFNSGYAIRDMTHEADESRSPVGISSNSLGWLTLFQALRTPTQLCIEFRFQIHETGKVTPQAMQLADATGTTWSLPAAATGPVWGVIGDTPRVACVATRSVVPPIQLTYRLVTDPPVTEAAGSLKFNL